MLFNVLSFFPGGSAALLSNHFGLSDPDGEAAMITWQHVGETLSVGPVPALSSRGHSNSLPYHMHPTRHTQTTSQQPLVFPR